MTQKWNLQDIRPAKNSAKPKEVLSHQPKSDIERPKRLRATSKIRAGKDYSSIDIVDTQNAKKKRMITSVVVAVLILGFGYIISILMGGADVTVHPRHKTPTIQATFTAFKVPVGENLSYELLTIEADGERQVSATGEEEVSKQAKGDILIYNNFSKSPQRLIKNTRFESPNGLIYRINESVEVPGYTENSDGEIAPGVITTTVFADGTGEQYNIPPSKFTIPGLKGSDQFDAMYAESNTDMIGGFEGTKFIIDDDELTTTKQSLQLELRDALLQRIDEEKPAGFILYKDAITFTFKTLPATEYGDKLATIKERALLHVPIFKVSELATFLAQNTVAGYEGGPVTLPDPLSLTFKYTSATTTLSDISVLSYIEFDLSGQTQIVWEYNEEALKNDIMGLPKTALPTVLSGYPAIEKANAEVRPFWKQSLPDDPSKINIIKQIEDDEE